MKAVDAPGRQGATTKSYPDDTSRRSNAAGRDAAAADWQATPGPGHWVRRRSMAVGLLALGLAPLVLLGCAKKKVLAVPNLPPETQLFIQGPVDAVNHYVHLYWFGSDPDGAVVGYELRFKNPEVPADSAWIFTTRTDSIFAVYTPAGFSAARFEVRAIDDSPTPRPW